MRLRALGMAMVMFGIAGVVAAWGVWFLKYRYFSSAAEIAMSTACTQHCQLDGPFMTAAVISGGLAVLGVVVAVSEVVAGGRHRDANARPTESS